MDTDTDHGVVYFACYKNHLLIHLLAQEFSFTVESSCLVLPVKCVLVLTRVTRPSESTPVPPWAAARAV